MKKGSGKVLLIGLVFLLLLLPVSVLATIVEEVEILVEPQFKGQIYPEIMYQINDDLDSNLLVDVLIPFSRDGYYGYVNSSLQEIIPPKYEQIFALQEGFVTVGLGGAYGFVNQKGHEVVKPLYTEVGIFLNGWTLVALDSENGSKWGVLGITNINDTSYFNNKASLSYEDSVQASNKVDMVKKIGKIVLKIALLSILIIIVIYFRRKNN